MASARIIFLMFSSRIVVFPGSALHRNGALGELPTIPITYWNTGVFLARFGPGYKQREGRRPGQSPGRPNYSSGTKLQSAGAAAADDVASCLVLPTEGLSLFCFQCPKLIFGVSSLHLRNPDQPGRNRRCYA